MRLAQAALLPLLAAILAAAEPAPFEVRVIPPDMVFHFAPRGELPGRPTLALALSGGGARGVAHIGVIERMEEIGLPVDGGAGTSAGALMGALMAAGFFWFTFATADKPVWFMMIGMFLVGIGWSAVISIVFAIMSERVNPAKMGLYMGVFNLAVVLPQMMSNGVANVIKATGNHQLLYIFCGLLVSTSVVFWMFVKEPESSGSTPNIPKGH